MKAYTLVLMLALVPVIASGESYLCIEQQSTGFRYNTAKKQWQQTNFSSNLKYLVKPNNDQSLSGKWIVSEVGESLPFARSEHDFTSTGALRGEGTFGRRTLRARRMSRHQTAV
jgi:hypothetical protein